MKYLKLEEICYGDFGDYWYNEYYHQISDDVTEKDLSIFIWVLNKTTSFEVEIVDINTRGRGRPKRKKYETFSDIDELITKESIKGYIERYISGLQERINGIKKFMDEISKRLNEL